MLLQLDLSSAFNTSDKSTMLRRLDPALNYISSYMAHRKQSVRVSKKMSSIVDCKHVVPQGSVLGPILFTQYVVPLAKIITSQGVNHT